MTHYNPTHWVCDKHAVAYWDDPAPDISKHVNCRVEVFSVDGRGSNNFGGEVVLAEIKRREGTDR